MLRSMFAGENKIDTNFSLKKKVVKFGTKPRTVLFQGGGDDVISSAKRNEVTNLNILTVGQITMQVPSPEPRAEEVNPNFRTPNWTLVGAIPIQLA